MTGEQHKRMGVAASVGVVTYALLSKMPIEVILLAVTIPMGAMLPDIDSNTSELGRVRKRIGSILKVALTLAGISVLIASFIYDGILVGVLNIVYVGSAILLITLIERNKFIKKQLGFIVGHRGIMHTLIPPAALIGITIWSSNMYVFYLVSGVAVGCLIHLLGDMATTRGAPVLWPVFKFNIKYANLSSEKNSASINVICNIWCIVFIVGVLMYWYIKM